MKLEPTVAQLSKIRSKLASSDSEGVKGQINQFGINMVDLMMWLVIAALLLAAALQGIGYYQQAAWTYQAKADVASVRTFMEAQFTLNANKYPAIVASDTPALQASGFDLKLTGGNKVATSRTPTGGWTATLLSMSLHNAGKTEFFNFGSADDPTTTWDETSNNIPASSIQNQTIISG